MGRRRRRGSPLRSIYSFLITWLILSAFFPLYRLWGLLLVGGAAAGVALGVDRLVMALSGATDIAEVRILDS